MTANKLLLSGALLVAVSVVPCRADEGNLAPAAQGTPARAASAPVDTRPRPLDAIPAGTVIGEKPPQGWSHLVLIATPRIGVGDVQNVPRTAAKYSGMMLFTLLANVRREVVEGQPRFALERLAMGTALDYEGRKIIATSEQTFGKDLGFIGRRVFQENENLLRSDVRQVGRTRTALVFDAKGSVLYNRRHAPMVIRHAVVVSPRDGTLTTFVWLLGSDGAGGYAVAEPTLQLLPPNFHEDRVLSVDTRKFTLGIPSPDAFALAHIPQGTPVRISATLSRLAAARSFSAETLLSLESELQERYAPLAARVAKPGTTRR